MHLWQAGGAAFFVYIMLVALLRRRSRQAPGEGGRKRLLAGAACGLAATAAASLSAPGSVLADWIWPPLVLLVAYWSSGLLFVAPMPAQERALAWLDERLAIRDVARHTPRVVAELLEAAYVGVYPLVAAALVLHLVWSPNPDPARFWSVVLLTDFICFGVMPWVQTRPPRALEPGDPWCSSSSIRQFNLRLLGATSIQVNTFPSGHAAEALAAALLILDAPLPVVAVMFAAALAVAAGAVLGRYHYAVDALIGWAVALVVWAAVR
jgi:membrane-associated phospholipid phosphatase